MKGLLAQIKKGEGQKLEFKTSFQKEVIETVVAFANAKGGKIFIGISNSAEIIGTTIDSESLQNHINTIKQNTQPHIIVDINDVLIKEKTILIIDVQEQPIKPIAYKNRYFKRIKNSNHLILEKSVGSRFLAQAVGFTINPRPTDLSRLMSLTEIANEHLKTINESWDCQINTRHDFDDISIDKAIKLINKIEHYQEKKFNDDIFTILRKYELIKNDQLTFGAYLLFVDNISSLTGLQIGRFKTDVQIIDSLNLNTDLTTEVEESMAFIRKNLMVEYIFTGELQRKERYDYPLEAIREIVTNMIVHRDYRDSGDSIIKIFDDHITFFNPGKLYNDLTIEKLQSGNYPSRCRNTAIAKMFKEVGSIEKYGSGIARIKRECQQHGIIAPIFEEFQHGFQVTLYKQKIDNAVSEGINFLYDYIKQNPSKRVSHIQKQLKTPAKTIERWIKQLRDEEKIEYRGSKKTGGYYAK